MNGNGAATLTGRLTRSTSEMSASERSAQADAMRRQLVELTAAHNRLARWVESQARTLAEFQSIQDSHGDRHQAFVSRSFIARLRWLLTGR